MSLKEIGNWRLEVRSGGKDATCTGILADKDACAADRDYVTLKQVQSLQ